MELANGMIIGIIGISCILSYADYLRISPKIDVLLITKKIFLYKSDSRINAKLSVNPTLHRGGP